MDLDRLASQVEESRRLGIVQRQLEAANLERAYRIAELVASLYRDLCRQVAARLMVAKTPTCKVFGPTPDRNPAHGRRPSALLGHGWTVARHVLLESGELIDARVVRAPGGGERLWSGNQWAAENVQDGSADPGEAICAVNSTEDGFTAIADRTQSSAPFLSPALCLISAPKGTTPDADNRKLMWEERSQWVSTFHPMDEALAALLVG